MLSPPGWQVMRTVNNPFTYLALLAGGRPLAMGAIYSSGLLIGKDRLRSKEELPGSAKTFPFGEKIPVTHGVRY